MEKRSTLSIHFTIVTRTTKKSRHNSGKERCSFFSTIIDTILARKDCMNLKLVEVLRRRHVLAWGAYAFRGEGFWECHTCFRSDAILYKTRNLFLEPTILSNYCSWVLPGLPSNTAHKQKRGNKLSTQLVFSDTGFSTTSAFKYFNGLSTI